MKKGAPTSKAAFIISGETLHSVLEIPVQSKSSVFLPLKNEKLKELQEKFKNCKILIIDEFSMLSQVMIAKVDSRLRQIKPDVDLIFGGISVILAGDPAQLLPVCATPVYDY